MGVITLFNFIQKVIDNIKAKLSENGQGMVEYALIIAVVAVIAAFVLSGTLKNSINSAFTNADKQINEATEAIQQQVTPSTGG